MLEKAIQIEVQNPEAYMLLARAWKQKGARQKALEFAKKAEILYQDEPARLKEVYMLKADLYKELGDHAKSDQYRRKASALH
jgi:tetratricopeptide (TPR) repeat protein